MPRSQSPIRAVAGFEHGRVPASVRAEQLLDVAERLFAETGYSATSIEAIAAAAGVTRPVVYNHYGSKEGVYLACLRRAREQMEALLFGAMAQAPDLPSRIEAGADAYFRFLERDPARWRVLFGGDAAVPPAIAEEAMDLHLATERRFASLLDDPPEDLDPQRVTAFSHAVGGAIHQLAQWWLRNPELKREQLVAWYCDVTWNGVRALLTPGPTAP